ncbi:MAG: heavy metal translocating P-type ATPase [Bacilli bacterium]|jgi:Cd2+/Zn2+-exporting ATPase|nr:heavy metal translocating P-type ATPase [Bacilli bacterium]MDY0363924.1 heavy metal translocating P-type ATPase [Bacilli bacterium]
MSKVKREIYLSESCKGCFKSIKKVLSEEGALKVKFDSEKLLLIIEGENGEVLDDAVEKATTVLREHRHQYGIDSSVNLRIKLKNISCANCAMKIENKISKISGVNTVALNFASEILDIDIVEDLNQNELRNNIIQILEELEPGAKIINEDELQQSIWQEHSLDIVRLIIGLVAFFCAFLPIGIVSQLILYIIAYLTVGIDVVYRAIRNLIKGRVFDENFLMAIATMGAFAIKNFQEAVAVMLFYKIGELFQDMAVDSSRKSITSLMRLKVDYANLLVGDTESRVKPETIKVDDIIIIKPGEKVPLDGIVVGGEAWVDTKALTGESALKAIGIDDNVLSGYINKNGLLKVKVTKIFSESTISKIMELVEKASNKKAKAENFITKFAKYYTPSVVILAVLLMLVPPIFVGWNTFDDWLYRALVFLVISCPCALVISIPLGFFGGIGGASKKGILVKGGNYLDALNHVDTVIFDKTGTLTKGKFKVVSIQSIGNFSEEELLKFAAYAESNSNHPIAFSILEAFGEEIKKDLIQDYEEIFGHGIKIKFENKKLIVGNYKLMRKNNINIKKSEALGTVIYIAVDKKASGYIVIEDEVRENSKDAVADIRNIGIQNIVMFTGDNKAVSNKVGNDVGITEVYSELLPNDKVYYLEKFKEGKNNKNNIVFIGDGINDAPVLAQADIGIAMGGIGTDAAIEAADVVIMDDNISKIAIALKIAKKTKKIIWQNIIFALSVKFIFLLLGALGYASMWYAVFADVGVSVIAIINATRALNVRKY